MYLVDYNIYYLYWLTINGCLKVPIPFGFRSKDVWVFLIRGTTYILLPQQTVINVDKPWAKYDISICDS